VHWLKRVRVIAALIFFFLTGILFLDIWNVVPASWSSGLASMQVLPALLRTLQVVSVVSIGLIFSVVLTLLFGRVYCSTICPLGTFQDLFIHLSRKIDRRKKSKYRKPYTLIHYSLFAAAAALFAMGSPLLLSLFEPFTNFGRIASNMFGLIVISLNNGVSSLLEHAGVLSVYHIPLLRFTVSSLLFAAVFTVFIGYLSYTRGRLFCNLLCPTGALLRLLSRFSIMKIRIDEDACKSCRMCENKCKANCIETETKKIDFSSCVGCFNCFDACPTNGVQYEFAWRSRPKNMLPTDESRRKFFAALLVPAAGMQMLPLTSETKNGYEENRSHPVSPPGSLSVRRFSNLCTACHLCVTACPSQVLTPSLFDYGIGGMLQPKMNYDASYCNYDCVVCSRVCPTGALLPLDLAEKKTVQIGKATFVKNDCIVVTKKADCGACSEHCPTKAVHMIPYERLFLPEVNGDLCIGCGACEHACPVKPNKAIYVTANPLHLKAKKPQEQKPQQAFDSNKDFPF
jgi:ferredoxin